MQKIKKLAVAGASLVTSLSMMVAPAAAATVAACTTTATVNTTNLSTWDFSQTRSAGHYELTEDGLHIYTDTDVTGDPDPRKVAGYYNTDFPLSGLGNQTIAEALDYTATDGIEPGLQLVVDFNNDGTPDGILVGESVYGENWWLTGSSAQFAKDGAPNTGGGNGSEWFGTAGEWLTAFPDAVVENIGFSLGSGVNGNGVINSINLGCVEYTFSAPVVVTAPTNKDQCKKDGWKNFDGAFKNQGDCVSYVSTGGRNKPARANF